MRYIVFDGDCGICSASAEFIRRNIKDSSIQIIPSFMFDFDKHGLDPKQSEVTVIFYDDANRMVYYRVRAVGEISKNLKGISRLFAIFLANDLSAFLLNPFYNLIAHNRSFISRKLGLNACKIK